MTQALYDKHNHGDRRTIVRKFWKGKELYVENSTIVLKTNVAMKVTEQYDATARRWQEVQYDLSTMVEITDHETFNNRPPPTSVPGGCDHIAAIATSGPCPVCFPRAQTRSKPWWVFW